MPPRRSSIDRPRSLILRVSDEELAKLRQLAAEGDEAMAPLVRRWLKKAWREAHGETKPAKKYFDT